MSVEQYISSGVLELYALHALSPEEMLKVEEMAAQNPRINDELEAIKQGLTKYAEFYAPPIDKGLYDKILSRIKDLPKKEEPAQVIAAPVVPVHPLPGKVAKGELKNEAPAFEDKEKAPVSFDGNEVKAGRAKYWMAIAACFVLLLISISINYNQNNQYNDLENQLAALQKENDTIANNNNSLKAQIDQTAAELKLYTDPENKMVMMKGMAISPASEVMVMWNTKSNKVFVMVQRLPAPPDGMQYQLWAIDNHGNPMDAGLLTPYKERKEKGPEQMSNRVMEATAFAITLEPKGGSPSPAMNRMYVKGGV